MQLAFAALVDLLLIPYFGWGIYMLRRRFRYHDEIAPGIQMATLAAVVLLYLAVIPTMEFWLHGYPLLLMFAVLGLVVSGAALYGHMVVSLLSWFLVDFLLPVREPPADQPRLGPVEALERQGDYEDALEGYMVLARIYPRNAEVSMRVAEVLARLARGEDAFAWIQRSVDRLTTPDDKLELVVRGCEVLDRKLGNAVAARALLQTFIAENPHTAAAEIALERLAHVGGARAHEHSLELAPLAGSSLQSATAPPVESRRRLRSGVTLVRLEGAGVRDDAESAEPDSTGPERLGGSGCVRLGVAPLTSDSPLESPAAENAERHETSLRIERIDTADGGSVG